MRGSGSGAAGSRRRIPVAALPARHQRQDAHRAAGAALYGCAWLYVVLRYAHTYVHLTANDVRVRVSVYFASGIVLFLMWTTLLVQLLRAG